MPYFLAECDHLLRLFSSYLKPYLYFLSDSVSGTRCYIFPFLFWISNVYCLVFQTSTLNCPQWKVCDESLIMLSISSLTDRTRKDFKQMKSDIETLKTLVSATKEEGEFPHTVAGWKFKVSSKRTVKSRYFWWISDRLSYKCLSRALGSQNNSFVSKEDPKC